MTLLLSEEQEQEQLPIMNLETTPSSSSTSLISSKVVRKIICTICSRLFNRSEHLQRHVLRHSGMKSYKCFCSKAFSRKDALVRHERIHKPDGKKAIKKAAALLASSSSSLLPKRVNMAPPKDKLRIFTARLDQEIMDNNKSNLFSPASASSPDEPTFIYSTESDTLLLDNGEKLEGTEGTYDWEGSGGLSNCSVDTLDTLDTLVEEEEEEGAGGDGVNIVLTFKPTISKMSLLYILN